MACACASLYYLHTEMLLALVFFMGVHSSFFGPAKYAILPEHLSTKEVVSGNGLIGMSTFIAIILGTLCSGIAKDMGEHVLPWIGVGALVLAALGYFTSTFIPAAPPHGERQKIIFHPWRSMSQLLQISRGSPSIHQSIVGNSWFWLLCAVLLAQVPAYTKFTLLGDATLASLLLVTFVVGISLGSLLCVFLSAAMSSWVSCPSELLESVWLVCTFVMLIISFTLLNRFQPTNSSSANSNLLYHHPLDLMLLAVFAAFFQIPIFALIQTRAAPELRSQVIAANNVINAMYMVIGTVVSSILTGFFCFFGERSFFELVCLQPTDCGIHLLYYS